MKSFKLKAKSAILGLLFTLCCAVCFAQQAAPQTAPPRFPRFKVLAFYSTKVERDHVNFAMDAIKFFKALTSGNGFVFDTTSTFNDMNAEKLKEYSAVIWLNDFPHNEAQRQVFQTYMENGGGWIGFHVAGYNDRTTKWPWFLDFLGGGVFYRNSWPPMGAKLVVDDRTHAVTRGMPDTYIAPANEWYQWKPSPRDNKDIKVLMSLSNENYPLGLKDILPDGDMPVMWTNTKYRMLYTNLGHGDKIFTDATQNRMITAALRWIVASDKAGDAFKK